MSIGTLLAYTIVSASVIILRYKPEVVEQQKQNKDGGDGVGDDVSLSSASTQSDVSENIGLSLTGRLKPEFWWLSSIVGGCAPGCATSAAVFLFTCFSGAFCVQLHFSSQQLKNGELWAIGTLIFLILCLFGCILVISAHHQNKSSLKFRVPFVPLIPALSIISNVGLMVHLNVLTWVRFIVWMTLGLLVYFLYGMRHSKESELTSSYSMLMTSSEAAKSQWGSIGGAAGGKKSGGEIAHDDRAVLIEEEEINE